MHSVIATCHYNSTNIHSHTQTDKLTLRLENAPSLLYANSSPRIELSWNKKGVIHDYQEGERSRSEHFTLASIHNCASHCHIAKHSFSYASLLRASETVGVESQIMPCNNVSQQSCEYSLTTDVSILIREHSVQRKHHMRGFKNTPTINRGVPFLHRKIKTY